MSRLVLSSIRSQRSAVPNYRGGCDIEKPEPLQGAVQRKVGKKEHCR